MKPFKISTVVKNYPWGRLLDEALVAKLSGATDRNTRYAELWVGAHPNSPSVMIDSQHAVHLEASARKDQIPGGVTVRESSASNKSNRDLPQLIKAAPNEMLGEHCMELFGEQLPFLLKILSIQQPLSIQLHPDPQLARELHQRDPINYPDKNHKPEIAIALSPVTLLHNVRDFTDSARLLQRFPLAFKRLITEGSVDPRLSLIKSVLSLNTEENNRLLEDAKQVIRGLVEPEEEDLWFLRAERLFPRDRGLWFFYILRLLHIKPGEAIFTGAGCLHAYLHGELIECMASSDNTIRVGLTGKFIDEQSLLRALRLPDAKVSESEKVDLGGIIIPERVILNASLVKQGASGAAACYRPPSREFAVTIYDTANIKVAAHDSLTDNLPEQAAKVGAHVYDLPEVKGPLLVLNLRGDIQIGEFEDIEVEDIEDRHQECLELKAGDAAFIPAIAVTSRRLKLRVSHGVAIVAHGNW